MTEHAFGWHLGIDELMFRDAAPIDGLAPGRMSVYSAVSFAALGLALAALPRHGLRPWLWFMAGLVALIGAVTALGFGGNGKETGPGETLRPESLVVALAFLLLAAGTFLSSFRQRSSAEPRERSSMESKVTGGFVGAFLVLLVGGGLAYRSNIESAQSAQWVAATLTARTQLSHVDASVSDAETAQRDYFLTGVAHYKADYARLAAESHRGAEAVAALTADSPSQRRLTERLKVLLAERLAEIEQTMAVYNAAGRDAAVALLETGNGARLMDAVDDVMQQLADDQAALLVQRQAVADGDRHNALLSIVLMLAWAAGVFVALLRSVRREMTARTNADERNHRLNAELELQVKERTASFEVATAALEAADAANRAKSVFLATMSHEIRTPMNGVIGMVEVLAHSGLQDRQADAVSTIRASAFALLGVIDDILDFSKIEAGKLELERMPVTLPELVESVCQTLSPLAVDKSVDLSMFIAPQVPHRVWSDATRLRQVLYNLAGNAIKFSAGRPGRGGWVSVRAVMTEELPPRLVFRIADNGIGMAPETLVHLFSSFTQAEASTTRRFGGTGLGLAICKRLVTLMNGEIEVQSAVQVGSTFIVTLPVEAVETGEAAWYQDLTGLACIVVGSAEAAADVRTYLTNAGAQVEVVDDLAHAARQAHVWPHAVVLHSASRADAAVAGLGAAFIETPGVHHLLILRGRQASPPVAAAGVSTLDGNCLRRSALLDAVALAAGRVLPETVDEVGAQGASGIAAQPPTVIEARAQGRLLLIAEDNEINRKVISRQIGLLGYAAEIAYDGAAALRLWRTGSHCLLLTDLHMPEMDGYTLTETIRREEATTGFPRGRMPILALTANAFRSEALKAQAAGMDEYLTKPLQLVQLGAVLAKWLPKTGQDPA